MKRLDIKYKAREVNLQNIHNRKKSQVQIIMQKVLNELNEQ